MEDSAQVNEKTIFTIGHSSHGLEKFLNLLRDSTIDLVVDIRSRPYSRYAPHFNKKAVSHSLEARGIKYLFLGDKLGGKPDDESFYDSRGNVLYPRIAETQGFHEGIERLLQVAGEYRSALMCSEEDPEKCHRYLLVSRFLEERGVRIIHIRGDGRRQSGKELVRKEEAQNGEIQQNLFNTFSDA